MSEKKKQKPSDKQAHEAFIIDLILRHKTKADFWRRNPNDPHNIGTAMMVMHEECAEILSSALNEKEAQ